MRIVIFIEYLLHSLTHVVRPSWPTFKSSTWVSVCYDSAFLQHLQDADDWSRAGFYWRSHFFIRGQLYLDKKSGRVFRALNAQHRIAQLWPMTKLQSSKSSVLGEADPGSPTPHILADSGCFTPDISPQAQPHFLAMLDWDSIAGATCEAVSPLGLVARGCPWGSVPHSVVVLQTSIFEHPCVTAAKKGFLGCSKDDLLKLAREKGICFVGPLVSKCV